MGTVDYQGLLALLQEVADTLERLTQTEQDKTQAVRRDDLAALNECMKREQVLSLALRGLDQKREAALVGLELAGVPLSGLAGHVPEEHRLQAVALAERLQTQFQIFRGASEVARDTLEVNLHQIEKALDELDGGATGGPGYRAGEPELPRPMRTDFRA